MLFVNVYTPTNMPKENTLECLNKTVMFVICNKELRTINSLLDKITHKYNKIIYKIIIPKIYFTKKKKIYQQIDFLYNNHQKYCLLHRHNHFSLNDYYLFYDFNINYSLVFSIKITEYNELNVNYLTLDHFDDLPNIIIPILNVVSYLYGIDLDINKLKFISIGQTGVLEHKKNIYAKFTYQNMIFKIGYGNNQKIRSVKSYLLKQNKPLSYIWDTLLPNKTISHPKNTEETFDMVDDSDEIDYSDYNVLQTKCINEYDLAIDKHDNVHMTDNVLYIEDHIKELFNSTNILDTKGLSNIDEYEKQMLLSLDINNIIDDFFRLV